MRNMDATPLPDVGRGRSAFEAGDESTGEEDDGDYREGGGGDGSRSSSSSASDDEAAAARGPPRLVSSMRVLDLQGNVGGGKSTLEEGIVKLCMASGDYVEVSHEDLDPHEIEEMCRDRRNNTFAFQLYCQRNRKAQFLGLREALSSGYRYDPSSNKSLLVVFDRSCLGDFVFAHYNQLQGNMSHEQLMEWSAHAVVPDHASALVRISGHYSELRDCIDPAMEQEVFITYLNKKPMDCKLQVDRVRRTAENTTPIHYYVGIHMAHRMLFNFLSESLEAARGNPRANHPNQHVFLLKPKPAIYYNAECFRGLIDDVRADVEEKKKRSRNSSPELHRSLEAIHGLSVDH